MGEDSTNDIQKKRYEKPDNLDLGQSRMNNENVMKNLFTLYNDLLDETGLLYKPYHIFNADESRVDLNSTAGMVVVATKPKHTYTEQKSLRDHISSNINEVIKTVLNFLLRKFFYEKILQVQKGTKPLTVNKNLKMRMQNI